MTSSTGARDFHFLSGNGNDFIALTSPTPLPQASEVSGWCRRGISLGADGVLHLERTSTGKVRPPILERGRRTIGLLLQWHSGGSSAGVPARLGRKGGHRYRDRCRLLHRPNPQRQRGRNRCPDPTQIRTDRTRATCPARDPDRAGPGRLHGPFLDRRRSPPGARFANRGQGSRPRGTGRRDGRSPASLPATVRRGHERELRSVFGVPEKNAGPHL